MLCSICGGKINCRDGLFVCENCGNAQTLSAYFENTEVFICYTEIDEQGRRTKDSIIAQDLYNKFENANIHTFYQRVSASDLTEKDFKEAYFNAISNAKLIVILACSKNNFENLLNENKGYISNKKILPVYKDMNAYDIPTEIAELQAMNYDNIGATSDLEKNILRFLGREQEIDIVAISDAKTKKKRRNIIVLLSIITVMIASLISYFVFCTPHVLKSNKYEYARHLVDEGQYTKAMEIYFEISEYKDSNDLLKKIYDKYNGYYENKNTKLCLSIQIINNSNIEISCDYDKTTFSITIPFSINSANFEFVDSKNNHGNGILTLTNDGINIEISTPEISDIHAEYSFDDRTDQKVAKLSKELLLSWLSQDVTVDMLKSEGYDFEFMNYIYAQLGEIYSLKNSSIKLFVGLGKYVTALSAPATILCPNRIGQNAAPYMEGNTIYAPYGSFPDSSIYHITSHDDVNSKTIEKDTTVYVTKRNLVDDISWYIMMEDLSKASYSYEDIGTMSSSSSSINYRVRKSANDSDSQVGAFTSLENAKEEADNYKNQGYEVYDMNGKLVYTP